MWKQSVCIFTSLFVDEICCLCSRTLRVHPGVTGSYAGPLRNPARVTGESLTESEDECRAHYEYSLKGKLKRTQI